MSEARYDSCGFRVDAAPDFRPKAADVMASRAIIDARRAELGLAPVFAAAVGVTAVAAEAAPVPVASEATVAVSANV